MGGEGGKATTMRCGYALSEDTCKSLCESIGDSCIGVSHKVGKDYWGNPINAVFMETTSQTKAKDPDGTNQALHSTLLLKAPPSSGRGMEPNACRGWASEAPRATTC